VSELPDSALALLQLERRLQSANSNREVAFRAVNDSSQALRYDQAVLWRLDVFSRPLIAAASGLADVAGDSPYQQWLVRLLRSITPEPFEKPQSFTLAELSEALVADGSEWAPAHLLHCPLRGPGAIELGGLLFFRAEPFSDPERAVAEWIAGSTGFALWAWRGERSSIKRWLKSRKTWRQFAVIAALAALVSLVPVRLSVLAPAEITAARPIPVTSPIEGAVREIVVKPNQIVKADELLVVLDDTGFRNRLELASRALDIARADQQRAIFKSFTDEASRYELQVLNARTQEKLAEVSYLTELLEKSKLTAPQGGIAVFSSQEDWRGRPVQVGERVMMIADPSLIDVTIYVPPEDAVELERGSEVNLLLHVDPLSPLQAKIDRSSYEATVAPDGTLAYVVRAELAPGQGLPRIGLRGTAKIYAQRVTLGYYLMRKPLAYLRRTLGV
jgi:multidrug efflux pump subunit AcrA (membrane-fusion protein)